MLEDNVEKFNAGEYVDIHSFIDFAHLYNKAYKENPKTISIVNVGSKYVVQAICDKEEHAEQVAKAINLIRKGFKVSINLN